TDNRLFRNLSYYNTSEGIRIDNNSDRAIVLNNTSFRNGKGILFDNNVDSCILRNNISLSNNNEGIQVVVAGGVTNSYNNSYGNGGGNNYVGTFRDGPGRISSNARFLSTHTNSSSFLRLSPTNSPCINTGSPDDPVPQKGGSRVDMGAIEVTNQPPQVILLTPANDSISGTNIVHFNWEPATGGTLGITNYKIEIASDINFINVAFSNTTAATSCQATLNDGKYYWHVRANDRAGNAGPWSLSRTITVGAEKTGALQEGEAKAYPVPCPRNRNLILEYGYNSGKVLEKVDLTVWDIFGNKVIDKNVLLESASPGKTEWDLKNSRNDKTMPGVYLYMIEIKYVDGSKVDSGYKKLIITK
ncbi:MAG: hypothetical protein JW827_12115, partial [Spirochaetes bacterium]|nr:hypothetical protein [Spirochaetota bacterium]